MSLDLCHQILKLLIQRDTLRTQNQFMQILAVVSADDEARVDVLVDEHVVEDNHVHEVSIPSTILEHCGEWAASASDNYVRRLLSCEPPALKNWNCVARC